MLHFLGRAGVASGSTANLGHLYGALGSGGTALVARFLLIWGFRSKDIITASVILLHILLPPNIDSSFFVTQLLCLQLRSPVLWGLLAISREAALKETAPSQLSFRLKQLLKFFPDIHDDMHHVPYLVGNDCFCTRDSL
ncbi:hypothetical protein Vretifemale_8037 [Volvox reticuliferus]|uniref:Uncharacterized protein n=1 Tax=Volvox reticuliferus TaxID=1737510 RepID=A0A8J4FMT7_9CHLO|nr:hypothetical protein Vretifemale_8037 [Volvox reticuliferus]